MTTSTAETATSAAFRRSLQRLYLVRFAFAVVWAILLVTSHGSGGPFLTILLVVYPLADAAAVLWQVRVRPAPDRAKLSEGVNIAVSIAVAIALGIVSTWSLPGALAVWGAWAIGSGLPQLITAIRTRRAAGQVPQMLSGGISLFAGAAFLVQGLQGSGSIVGVAGYATLGAVYFLASAIRLTAVLRQTS